MNMNGMNIYNKKTKKYDNIKMEEKIKKKNNINLAGKYEK